MLCGGAEAEDRVGVDAGMEMLRRSGFRIFCVLHDSLVVMKRVCMSINSGDYYVCWYRLP